MTLKMVVLDLEMSKRAKRIAAAVLVPVLVMAGGAIAYANVPHTWKNGDVLTATDLNADMADLDSRIVGHESRLTTLEAARGKASYKNVASFSVPPATSRTVPYTTKLHDDRGEFDATSHAFTAKTAGDYEVCASFIAAQNVDGGELGVFLNGVQESGLAEAVNSASPGAGMQAHVTGCRTVRVAAGDVIDVRFWHGGTTTIQFSGASDSVWDWITIYERRQHKCPLAVPGPSTPGTCPRCSKTRTSA